MKAPPIWKPMFLSLTQKASNRKVILNIDARTSIEKSHKTEFRGSQEIFKFFKFRSRLFPSICSKILFYKRPYYKIYLNLIRLIPFIRKDVYDPGIKSSAFKCMLADCTKKYCKFHCARHSDKPPKAWSVFSRGFRTSWVLFPLHKEKFFIFLLCNLLIKIIKQTFWHPNP